MCYRSRSAVQKSEVGCTGLKSGCGQGYISFWGLQGRKHFLPFPAGRGTYILRLWATSFIFKANTATHHPLTPPQSVCVFIMPWLWLWQCTFTAHPALCACWACGAEHALSWAADTGACRTSEILSLLNDSDNKGNGLANSSALGELEHLSFGKELLGEFYLQFIQVFQSSSFLSRGREHWFGHSCASSCQLPGTLMASSLLRILVRSDPLR